MTKPLLAKGQLEFIADKVAPLMGWPTVIHQLADELATANPKFDREKFISRAVNAWEKHNPPPEIDDEIPY